MGPSLKNLFGPTKPTTGIMFSVQIEIEVVGRYGRYGILKQSIKFYGLMRFQASVHL